jgi:hypothetical protein
MLGYALFGLSLAAALLLIVIGFRMNVPVAIDASAQDRTCCAYRGPDSACVPCRPTRGAK